VKKLVLFGRNLQKGEEIEVLWNKIVQTQRVLVGRKMRKLLANGLVWQPKRTPFAGLSDRFVKMGEQVCHFVT